MPRIVANYRKQQKNFTTETRRHRDGGEFQVTNGGEGSVERRAWGAKSVGVGN